MSDDQIRKRFDRAAELSHLHVDLLDVYRRDSHNQLLGHSDVGMASARAGSSRGSQALSLISNDGDVGI